jgi:putative nucleotidyltransferase with HDIG domain
VAPHPITFETARLAESAGRWHHAIGAYARVARESLPRRDLPTFVRCVLHAGNCYRRLADTEAALDHFELALALAVLDGDDEAAGRALNGMATIHQQRGDPELAEQTYHAAHAHARRGPHPQLLATVEQNLGTLASARGQLDAAVAHFEASLARFEQLGDARGCAEVLNNLGDVHTHAGRMAEATRCLDRALRFCLDQPGGDPVTAGLIRLSRAELHLASGEHDLARQQCEAAFEACCRLGIALGTGESLRVFGQIVRAAGESSRAEQALRRAVEIGERHGAPLLQAEALHDLGLALRALGRNREALEAFNRSHRLFRRAQADHRASELDRRLAQFEQEFLALMRRWGESIEAKDRYTGGHCERVAEYACLLAGEVALQPGEMLWFRMGAYLHDIGKTGIPEAILNKPGPLTPEERALVRTHAELGEQMLAGVEFPWDVPGMVRWHHERWDGRGYPDGLCGQEIPLPARILCIADVFDALTTARSYHVAMTPAQAIRQMEADASAFDPELFSVFRELRPRLVAMA